MTPVITGDGSTLHRDDVEAYGLRKSRSRVKQAIDLPGTFVFEGSAASAQAFKDGGVVVVQGGKMRGVQPDIFMRTYRLSNGRAIGSVTADLKSQCVVR
ncbi:MAG: hypothetical protein KME27_17440 [Lyngbya sp. HA4199-MV5]|jgi:hypothetical protein|nr:hypothetical protein [Lyngbya sp. HA4199-MV5]